MIYSILSRILISGIYCSAVVLKNTNPELLHLPNWGFLEFEYFGWGASSNFLNNERIYTL